MNAVLTLSRNNLHLTQRAIWAALRQDIKTTVGVVDNGSTDGTVEWLRGYGFLLQDNAENRGVSEGWNYGLQHFFSIPTCESVLVIGNDTQLAPWTYRKLLSYRLPFVTGVAVDDMAQIEQAEPPSLPLEPHPDFSCFLIRRDAWRRIGPFNTEMKLYASDCDYHIRGHRLGVALWKACVPFYHERSSTLRLAKPEEQQAIQEQANRDRALFYQLYGCFPGQPEYYNLFKETNPVALEGSLSGKL